MNHNGHYVPVSPEATDRHVPKQDGYRPGDRVRISGVPATVVGTRSHRVTTDGGHDTATIVAVTDDHYLIADYYGGRCTERV